MNSPTYADIAKEVQRIGGFVPKTCWTAHVKSHFGLTARMWRIRPSVNPGQYNDAK